jgi:hypothetical protein
MIFEPTVYEQWRISNELAAKIPLDRITTGATTNLEFPFATLNLVENRPALKTNSGTLREEVVFKIDLWGEDHDELSEILFQVDYFYNDRILTCPKTFRRSRVRRVRSISKRHPDGVWQMTAHFEAKISLVLEAVI